MHVCAGAYRGWRCGTLLEPEFLAVARLLIMVLAIEPGSSERAVRVLHTLFLLSSLLLSFFEARQLRLWSLGAHGLHVGSLTVLLERPHGEIIIPHGKREACWRLPCLDTRLTGEKPFWILHLLDSW